MHGLGTIRHLDPGTTLFTAGDRGAAVYLVVEGALEIVHATDEGDIVAARLGPGEVVGEIAAVVGGRRTATVRTGDLPAIVRELSAAEFSSWQNDDPEAARRIAAQARDRIDRTRVTRVVTELIGSGHDRVVSDVVDQLEWSRLEAGATLFRQGDAADAAYIVVSGRLRLVAIHAGLTTIDASAERGDVVGELGVIERAPRAATAIATRNTTLARLSEAAFETLTVRHPRLMLQVFRRILAREGRPPEGRARAGVVAVAVTSPSAQPRLVRSIAAEIDTHGTTMFVDRGEVARFFDRRGVVDAQPGTAEDAALAEFLREADAAHRWVVLETDPTLTPWTVRALRSADRVAIVTSPFPDERELDLVRRMTEIVDATPARDLWMVQTNRAVITRPVVSRSVVATCRPDRILQHRSGDEASTARIARLLSGTATGVALSGGGGRAFAQIGALRALDEAGFDIDVVAGTSMGSIVAGMFAMVADTSRLADVIQDGFRDADILDYTLPLVSLTSGKGLTAAIQRTCGPLLIEELALPFICLSTNLTAARLVEHARGSLAAALRSSVSLPGVFPPVVVDGDLLVDGGIMENLPVGPLVRDPAVATIVAVDVAPASGPISQVAYGTGVSGREVLRGRFTNRRSVYPGIADTIVASMLLASARARNDALADGRIDHYLSLELGGVKLLDFSAIDEVAERGYRAALSQLEAQR